MYLRVVCLVDWHLEVFYYPLRSMDRANEVYESMLLRGYKGDYRYLKDRIVLNRRDIFYFLFWVIIFLLFRWRPVILLIGSLFGGFFV